MPNRFRKRVLLPLLGIAAVLSAAAAPARAQGQGAFPITVILPLTGNASFVGQGMQQTLRAVQASVNKDGGIRGQPIEFVFRDDQTSPQLAVQLTTAALAQHPPVVLGSGLVAMCNAMAPLVRNGPFLYCLSPAAQPPAGSFMFSTDTSTHDLLQADFRYFRGKGWNRIALISSTDATGQDFQAGVAAVMKLPENAGLKIVENARFNQGDTSVAAQMERIKAADPQVVVTWTTGGPVATVFKGIVQAGITVPIVTTNGNQTFAQMDQYADFLPKELIIATSLFVPHPGHSYDPRIEAAQANFYATMKANDVPVDVMAAHAWDPGMMVVAALRQLGTNAAPAQIRDYLAGLTDYAGINGVYDFKTVPQRGLDVSSAVVTRWSPADRQWTVVSAPAGAPLQP